MKLSVIVLCLMVFFSINSNAQYQWTGPFSKVKIAVPKYRAALVNPVVNTSGISVSIPGYYYSSNNQQSVVVGIGYTFQHYVSDTLIYSLGPYIWYDSPIPTGSIKKPVGYGAAGTYRGKILLGGLTPDFVHFGAVVTLNFTFGNGTISF